MWTVSDKETSDSTPRPEDEAMISRSSSRVVLQEAMMKRTVYAAGLVLFLGAIASAGFMYVGITNSKSDNETKFDQRASELVEKIQSTWNDYETAGLWIHESCRNRHATRQEFRAVYEYLSSDGLEFQAAEWIPRVSREERVAYEEESLKFYEEFYPEVLPYLGLRGLEPDPENPATLSMQLRSEQPFYYPVSFVEPVLPNAAAIDFDLYSSASRRATIEVALETYKPTLTRRLRLVQETDPSAYSVLLMHPGIPLEAEGPQAVAKDLSLMVIRIPSLLERSVRDLHGDQKAVYIYDVTEAESKAEAQFLGAIKVESTKNGEILTSIDEVDYTTFASSNTDRRDLFYEDGLEIGESEWIITVVALEGEYDPNIALVVLGGSVLFVATVCLAIWMVQNAKRSLKMQRVLEEAEAEKRIVSSLFPSTVRDRLLYDATHGGGDKSPGKPLRCHPSMTVGGVYGTKPIADLFPNVSIMFGDLVGFTSWASARDPQQVFTLLEVTYHSFDEISEELGIFKVETVGDCYVAASGIPEARLDHAEAMAVFASRCTKEMSRVARELEPILGPDTGDIQIRVGVHCGQVTAGVLRGLKGRFQLFGDTVNTASRMETTGQHGMIHVSQEFADQLKARGKGDWLTPRTDIVTIKGKGLFQTFWLEVDENRHRDFFQPTLSSGSMEMASTNVQDKSTTRLVTWNVQLMMGLLKKIVAHRMALGKETREYSIDLESVDGTTPLEEVQDMIALPEFTSDLSSVDPESVELDPKVVVELQQFVEALAQCYNIDNSFHNFEHASHVTMSVSKLLKRIVDSRGSNNKDAKATHDGTFGIASDPLTHFACIFAALIHDVDHPGVPNATLVSESAFMAMAYHNQSVAEQNSTDLAWKIFTGDELQNLRKCICSDREEFLRFRQLLVTIVMATDVMDKQLNGVRRERWDRVFTESADIPEKELIHRKATIVLEHLMQASDVAHTMQHWLVYLKWNQRLFMETYSAFKAGRVDKDPSTDWYESEIGFLDYYVIPLAKKLDTCGVFGVSSDEYLGYAVNNRREWEKKGKALVSSYLKEYEGRYGG